MSLKLCDVTATEWIKKWQRQRVSSSYACDCETWWRFDFQRKEEMRRREHESLSRKFFYSQRLAAYLFSSPSIPSGRREEWRVKMVKEEESHNCRNLPNKRRKRLKKLNTRWNLQPFYLFNDLEFSFSVSRCNLHKNSFLIQIDVRCNKKDRDGDCEMRMSTKKYCQDSQS